MATDTMWEREGLDSPDEGTVPLRRVIGPSPASGRWGKLALGAIAGMGWVVAGAMVFGGGYLLWHLLFGDSVGGDVWLGEPAAWVEEQAAGSDDDLPGGVPWSPDMIDRTSVPGTTTPAIAATTAVTTAVTTAATTLPAETSTTTVTTVAQAPVAQAPAGGPAPTTVKPASTATTVKATPPTAATTVATTVTPTTVTAASTTAPAATTSTTDAPSTTVDDATSTTVDTGDDSSGRNRGSGGGGD